MPEFKLNHMVSGAVSIIVSFINYFASYWSHSQTCDITQPLLPDLEIKKIWMWWLSNTEILFTVFTLDPVTHLSKLVTDGICDHWSQENVILRNSNFRSNYKNSSTKSMDNGLFAILNHWFIYYSLCIWTHWAIHIFNARIGDDEMNMFYY